MKGLTGLDVPALISNAMGKSAETPPKRGSGRAAGEERATDRHAGSHRSAAERHAGANEPSAIGCGAGHDRDQRAG